MQRIFRRVTPSLLRHVHIKCHFNTLAPAPATGIIKQLIPQQPCWHGLDKWKLEACAPPKRQPEELRKLIEEAKVPPARNRQMSPRRKPDEMGRWLCNQCGQMLYQDAFFCRIGRNSPESLCRKCNNTESLLYRRTLRGNLMLLRASALRRARMKGLEFNLEYPDLIGMLEIQGGTCAYSGMSMEVEQPNSHWRMSLERVDNSLGYTTSNCVLIAAEFNSGDASRGRNVDPESVLGSAQWSRHKVEEIRRLQTQPIDLNQLAVHIQHAQDGEHRTTQPKMYRAGVVGENCDRTCANCRRVLPLIAFYGQAFSSCKDCCRQRQRLYYRSLRGHLATCLGGARRRAKLREQDCTITRGFLLDLLAKQGGRCFYSGVPLQYEQIHTDWQMSIERLDNSLGYTPENCVLIAVEFNTPDYSRNKAVTEVFGTAQWSCEKVWHVWRF